MEKKSNKGFTLIELLVVIAIMGSILVLAIASLNKISKAKKKESYQKVKNQAEVAAEQYINANEYRLEGMNNGDIYKISVGRLINEDYLNTLTNPVTGKKINKCDYIEITKKNAKKYEYKYIEDNSITCDYGDYELLVKSPSKKASSKLVYFNEENRTVTKTQKNWFNINKLKRNGNLKVCAHSTGEINITKIEEGTNTGNTCLTYKTDFDVTEKSITVTYENGTTETFTETFGKDTIEPSITSAKDTYSGCDKESYTINYYDNIEDYNNASEDNINLYVYDETSKVSKIPTSENITESKDIEISDNAENVGRKSIVISKKDCTTKDDIPPIITVKVYKRVYDSATKAYKKGTKVLEKTYQGNNIGDNTILIGNWPNWVNMYNYPNGIFVEYSSNEILSSIEWTWNKAYLNKTRSESNDYNWNNSTKLYNGIGSGSKTTDYNVSANETISYSLGADGFREARIYAYDNSLNETAILIKMAKDSTGPKITSYALPRVETNNNCVGETSKTKYSNIYTSFSATDELSGIKDITHYIDGIANNNKDSAYKNNFYYEKVYGGFISIKDGKYDTNSNYYKYINSKEFDPITEITNGFTIKRAWANIHTQSNKSDNMKVARKLGCGTVGSQTPEIEKAKLNCNYITVSDTAGNTITQRVCASGSDYKNVYTYAKTQSDRKNNIYPIVEITK